MEQELLHDPTSAIALSEKVSLEEELRLHPLIQEVKDNFNAAKDGRREIEDIWVRVFYNFLGRYGEQVAFTSTEKSQAFLKITKTKCLAAFGQIIDVLFGGGDMPIKVEPTPDPLGVAQDAFIDLNNAKEEEDDSGEPIPGGTFGFEGDGRILEGGETFIDRIGTGLKKVFKGAKVQEGKGDPTKDIQISPAEFAADKMNRRIHDQLVESDAESAIHNCIMEQVILGTGCIKGPVVVKKEYPRWNMEGKYSPVTVDVPRITSPSVWSIYPDPEAQNPFDRSFVIERHRFSKHQLRELNKRPHFRESEIELAIDDGPNWVPEHWEHQIDLDESTMAPSRWEVLEWWGMADAKWLKELGVSFPPLDELRPEPKEYPVNVWITGNRLLRVVINPFTPARDIYLLVPYEVNPYSQWGIGASENMEHLQTLMNGFLRLGIDNAVLSSNLIFEMDEDNLVPGQNMEISTGKIFRRSGGAPGQAIFSHKIPNTTNETMAFYKELRAMTDEVTGIPSISHGQTGVTGTNRTAAGVSMIMGAASVNIKTVIKNIDNFLLKPLGTALYSWNMQFNFDDSIVGDLAIKATGMTSLLRKEVQSQRLIQFIQAGQTPMTAPFINFEYLLREGAKSLDIDPDKAVLDPKRAKLQAEILAPILGAQDKGVQGGPKAPPDQGPGNPVQDPNQSGNGNIGGSATPPTPGEQGFAGNQQPPQV